jgi:NDP-sugar pyrophosphorylase family protein
MNVIMLAAGISDEINNKYPIFLTEVKSKLIIQHQIDCLDLMDNLNIILVINKEINSKFHIDSIIQKINKNITIVNTKSITGGALFSSLLCADLLDIDKELLVMNCNEFININFKNFIYEIKNFNNDVVIATHKSIHPRYSYVELEHENRVVGLSINKPPTGVACTGLVWQKSARVFLEESEKAILKLTNFEEDFYFNLLLNQMILDNLKIHSYNLDANKYFPLKNKEHIAELQLNFMFKNENI